MELPPPNVYEKHISIVHRICSFIGGRARMQQFQSFWSKSVIDKVVENTEGESRIGIPECDEVMDEITAEMINPDDGYITKAAKQTFLNRIKENLRESLEQNSSNKAEMAKNCREFKKQLENFKAGQSNTKVEK